MSGSQKHLTLLERRANILKSKLFLFPAKIQASMFFFFFLFVAVGVDTFFVLVFLLLLPIVFRVIFEWPQLVPFVLPQCVPHRSHTLEMLMLPLLGCWKASPLGLWMTFLDHLGIYVSWESKGTPLNARPPQEIRRIMVVDNHFIRPKIPEFAALFSDVFPIENGGYSSQPMLYVSLPAMNDIYQKSIAVSGSLHRW